jgi:hypothetical protein
MGASFYLLRYATEGTEDTEKKRRFLVSLCVLCALCGLNRARLSDYRRG